MSSSPFYNGFPQLELPLSMADWKRLPRNPAYKYEYFDQRAVLTPRPHTHCVRLNLASWQSLEARAPLDMRVLVDADWAGLTPLFQSAFSAQLPFSCLSEAEAAGLADACLNYTRAGKDGELVPQACLAASDTQGVTGAALVTLHSGAKFGLEQDLRVPHLTWIFVHPFAARRGCGRALLQEIVFRLRDLHHNHLASTFLIGNSASTLWHWRMGFELVVE